MSRSSSFSRFFFPSCLSILPYPFLHRCRVCVLLLLLLPRLLFFCCMVPSYLLISSQPVDCWQKEKTTAHYCSLFLLYLLVKRATNLPPLQPPSSSPSVSTFLLLYPPSIHPFFVFLPLHFCACSSYWENHPRSGRFCSDQSFYNQCIDARKCWRKRLKNS